MDMVSVTMLPFMNASESKLILPLTLTFPSTRPPQVNSLAKILPLTKAPFPRTTLLLDLTSPLSVSADMNLFFLLSQRFLLSHQLTVYLIYPTRFFA